MRQGPRCALAFEVTLECMDVLLVLAKVALLVRVHLRGLGLADRDQLGAVVRWVGAVVAAVACEQCNCSMIWIIRPLEISVSFVERSNVNGPSFLRERQPAFESLRVSGKRVADTRVETRNHSKVSGNSKRAVVGSQRQESGRATHRSRRSCCRSAGP